MDSEFVLDSAISSCQVVQGNGVCKFNICEHRKYKTLGMSQMTLKNDIKNAKKACKKYKEGNN